MATAIHETLFRLREEKLPHVLEEVNAIFRLLTGGNYDKISIHEDGYFVAQDALQGYVIKWWSCPRLPKSKLILHCEWL